MRLEIKNIEIDKTQVIKFLGYANKKLPPIIERKIDEEIETVGELLRPEAFLKPFKITQVKDGVTYLEKGCHLESNYLAEQSMNASSLYFIVYTIGDAIEEKINTYSSSSEMIRAMILDKIGVVALDYIKGEIKKVIKEQVAPNKICIQLFPGTKDFEISNQKKILDVFQEENTTINISKHYQLSPIKTVAAVFGIGQVEDQKSMCDQCDNKCY